ncbi:MAG: helix-turn-helix transcriptional regulator [Deltaproteobacteria bacterium]
MERAERLLDLVALFLNAREAVAWADIQEAFPEDYAQGSSEANIRKFERDKADLLELGISLVYLQGEEREKDGYQLDRSGYYLPELGLRPDEVAVLYAAGASALAEEAFPFRDDLAHALKKMAFAAGDEPGVARDWARQTTRPMGEAERARRDELASRVALLSRAVAGRKRATLRYENLHSGELAKREVDPYGLVYRSGSWLLAGHCHLRGDRRTFRVDRIRELTINDAKPRSPDFEIPGDFELGKLALLRPWEYPRHPPLEVLLWLSPDLAFLGERSFSGGRIVEQGPKKGLTLALRVADGDALLRSVLPLGPGAEIVGPPELRSRARALLEDLLARHAPDARPLAVGNGRRRRG